MAVGCTLTYKKKDISTKEAYLFFKALEKHHTTVGVHKEQGSKQVGYGNFTLIKNACLHEFGGEQTVKANRRFRSPVTGEWFFIKAGTVLITPPRPFVRIFKNNSKLKRELRIVFKQQIDLYKRSKKPIEIYNSVGDYAKLVMKSRIMDKKVKPSDSQMTIKYKGFNHPLYLTGTLFDAIEKRVY